MYTCTQDYSPGNKGTALNGFHPYSLGSTYSIITHNQCSPTTDITSGVPQGPCLGPFYLSLSIYSGNCLILQYLLPFYCLYSSATTVLLWLYISITLQQYYSITLQSLTFSIFGHLIFEHFLKISFAMSIVLQLLVFGLTILLLLGILFLLCLIVVVVLCSNVFSSGIIKRKS